MQVISNRGVQAHRGTVAEEPKAIAVFLRRLADDVRDKARDEVACLRRHSSGRGGATVQAWDEMRLRHLSLVSISSMCLPASPNGRVAAKVANVVVADNVVGPAASTDCLHISSAQSTSVTSVISAAHYCYTAISLSVLASDGSLLVPGASLNCTNTLAEIGNTF